MSDEKTAAQAKLAADCRAFGVQPGHVYRHYKGGFYVVFAVSIDEATLLPSVHYYSIERQTRWTRPLTNFGAVMEDHTAGILRFACVRPATRDELAQAFGVTGVVL